MIKITILKNGLTHDWFTHKPDMKKWSDDRTKHFFESKVRDTYGKFAEVIKVVDDETDEVIYEKA